MMSKKPVRIVGRAEYELPLSFNREIGRILVRWAYFEHVIRRTAWDVLGVDTRVGRVAIRDPRMDDHIDMIRDLAFLKKINIDEATLKSLTSKAREVSMWRDLFSHGIWIQTPTGWTIQMISGSYPKDYETEHKKRRINPEAINVDLDGLRTLTNASEILIDEAVALRDSLAERLPPSPDIRP